MGLTRVTGFDNLKIPVVIAHGHLDLADRLNAKRRSREVLQVNVEIEYECPPPKRGRGVTFDDVFNYAPVVKQLLAYKGTTLVAPLESIADTAVRLTAEHARRLRLRPVQIAATVLRPRLAGLDIRIRKVWRA